MQGNLWRRNDLQIMVCRSVLHRTTRHVIPRRGNAPTWESPGTMFIFVYVFDEWYQEIATSHG